MEQNYSAIRLPTVGTAPNGSKTANVFWLNPSRITADDGSSASLNYSAGGDFGSTLMGSVFNMPVLPASAVIDGIQVSIDGMNNGCYGTVKLNLPGTAAKDMGSLAQAYGGPKDKWGASNITIADLNAITVTIDAGDVSGGDGFATVDYMSVRVFWHIAVANVPATVPTRVEYKTYSSDKRYLGNLPGVSSKLGFSQDIGSAGASIQIECAQYMENVITVEPIQDETGAAIQDDNNLDILGITSDTIIATGDSIDDAIFKNGNRVEAWLYDYWHPNGKKMFSGQINRVRFKPRGNKAVLTVYSDGLDLDQFIARGYPFNYTLDVQQGNSNDSKNVIGYSFGGWDRWGQTFKTGVGITNIGAIMIRLNGSADVTVTLRDAPNGNILTSVTRSVVTSGWYGWENIRFDFPQLIDATGSTDYFFSVQVADGQSILIATSPSDVYFNGTMYYSSYSGGSGGGSYTPYGNDIYFETYSGLPTTTTTYSTQDPVTGMMRGILLDYNARGGFIKERNFTATGLSLTYIFNSASIFDAMKKVIEMSPVGFYPYIDLGTAEMDILQQSTTADFTVTRCKEVDDLEIDLSIEKVKNYLLFSGGEVTPGVNLFRDYLDSLSSKRYGPRMAAKSDNRVIQTGTADAIGNSFIAENSKETQETQLFILNYMMDITLLVPGKTIGFKNYGNFVDSFVLQIARRDYTPEGVLLTLGQLPVRMSDEIQRINRDMLLQQTIGNPNAPS